MTAVRLAVEFDECGEPLFRVVGRDISLAEARDLVRSCLSAMNASIERKLDRQDAAAPERRQIKAAMEALRSSFAGALTSVRAGPRQHYEEPAHPARPAGEGGPRYQGRDPQQDRGRYAQQDKGRYAQQDTYGSQHRGPGQDPDWNQEQHQQRQQHETDGGGGVRSFVGNLFGRSDPTEPAPAQPSPGPPDPAIMVISQALYSQLSSACEAIDRILEVAEPPPEKEEVPWARTSEFLEEVHPLLTAYLNEDGKRALEQLELLEERLRTRYGIEAKAADEDTASMFTVHPNKDPLDGSYETRVAALLIDEQVWRKGEAIGPVAEQHASQTERGRSDRVEERPENYRL